MIIGNITLTGVCCASRTIASSWSRQQLRMRQRQPDATDTEERVHLGGRRQELQRLVAANIEGAQRDPAPVERFGDLAVDRELLLDIRCVLAAEEQELGAHQAREVRAVGRRRPGVVHRADVCADREP